MLYQEIDFKGNLIEIRFNSCGDSTVVYIENGNATLFSSLASLISFCYLEDNSKNITRAYCKELDLERIYNQDLYSLDAIVNHDFNTHKFRQIAQTQLTSEYSIYEFYEKDSVYKPGK